MKSGPTFYWTGVDQGLSALANLLGTVLVARAGSTESLGVYAVAFAVYLAGLGLVRASVGDPLVVSGASQTDLKAVWGPAWAVVVPSLLGASILTALDLSVAAVVVIVLPALFVQSALRYAAFARRRPQLAALTDGVWVVSSVALGLAMAEAGNPTLAAAAWAVGGVASAIVAIIVHRAWPTRPLQSFASVGRIGKGLTWPLMGESAAVSAALTLLVPVVLALISLPYAGLFRAASAIAGPMAVVMTAWEMYSFPVISNASGGQTAQIARRLVQLGTLIGAIALLATLAIADPLQALLFAGANQVPSWMVAALASALVLGVPGGVAQAVLKRHRLGGTLLRIRLIALAAGALLSAISLLTSSVMVPFAIPAVTVSIFGLLAWRKATNKMGEGCAA